MDNGIFTDGLLPGAPKNDFEIKFLICYLLDAVGEPVSFGQLAATFQKTGLVNYFAFASVISEMIRQGHICAADEKAMAYALTAHGRSTARSLGKTIPFSVRERCENELRRLLKLVRRRQENEVRIERTEDGYTVALEIPDIGTPLMRLELFMPTREHCEQVERRFLNDPLFFYRGVMALATGDMQSVGELLPSGEELFD